MKFSGEKSHNIDNKGRIVIPACFREEFPDSLVVTKGFEGCLNIYTPQHFDKIAENLEKLPPTKKAARTYVRLFNSRVEECEIDSQNRINLSATMIREAGIIKQCVFIGAINYIELWAAEKWEEWLNDNDGLYEETAEKLTDMLDE